MVVVDIPKEAKAKKLPQIPPLIKRWKGAPPAKLTIDSDNHFPLHHRGFQEAKLQFIEDVKPDVHVTLGDHWDFTNLSRYDRDPRFSHTLKDEFDSSREYEARVCLAAKRRILVQGNHEARLWKTVMANHAFFGLLGSIKELARLHEKVEEHQHGTVLQVGHAWLSHGEWTKTRNPTYWSSTHYDIWLGVHGHWHRPSMYRCMRPGQDGKERRREFYTLGHGQDPRTVAEWAGPFTGWSLGFLFVEQDSTDFYVHEIIANKKGEFIFNGKKYKG